MGAKSSHFMQSDRPESGGADKDGIREKNGLLERNKEHFAAQEKKEKEGFGMIPGADERMTEAERARSQGDGQGEDAQGGPGGNQGT